jgi:hypothetical protein
VRRLCMCVRVCVCVCLCVCVCPQGGEGVHPPVVIGYGNLVVSWPLDTPELASSHQLYPGRPRDLNAKAGMEESTSARDRFCRGAKELWATT